MKPKLLYRWNETMESFVFADEVSAIRTDQLHRAIYRSKTWADLKAAVHPDDYWFVVSMFHDHDENTASIEPTGDIDWNFYDQETYSEGIYPSFLIYDMEDIIPDNILQMYGSEEVITDYGSYRRIAPKNLVPMITALTNRGYEVAPAGDLIFDYFYAED